VQAKLFSIEMGLANFLPGWPGTLILSVSASEVARITGGSHQHPVLLIFSKTQLLVSSVLATAFLFSYFIYLCSHLHSFFLLVLGLACSSFSNFLRCKVRLFCHIRD
jgi:hypothetical protein